MRHSSQYRGPTLLLLAGIAVGCSADGMGACPGGVCVDGSSGGQASGGGSAGGSEASGGVATGGGMATGGTAAGGLVGGDGGAAVGTGGALMSGGSAGAATGGIGASGGATADGGTGTGGAIDVPTTAPGKQLGDTCNPICSDASSDPDGDGWGWENEASCVVVDSTPYMQGTDCEIQLPGLHENPVGGGDCAAPVNPNATTQVENLLCYFYSIYGKQVLSGQQETSWSNPEGDISWYVQTVGQSPAILGGDYLYPDGTTDRAIAYWQAGGITMLRYHMGAPPLSDTYENSQGEANIANVLMAGTAENQSFNSKLDYAATELERLQDANVPVVWAPFHEFQPGGWFWWSKGTPEQFKALWVYTYNYLTTTKGLDNLLWLAPSSGSVDASWYPEKAYYDLAGPDTYATNPPFLGLFGDVKAVVGTTVPIPLHETGVVPQPSIMFPDSAPWLLWNIWAGYQQSENSVAEIQSAYASPYTITRDEVPDLN